MVGSPLKPSFEDSNHAFHDAIPEVVIFIHKAQELVAADHENVRWLGAYGIGGIVGIGQQSGPSEGKPGFD